MGNKVITVADILEAMEANNIPHQRGAWFKNKAGNSVNEAEDKIGSACILGQTAINLGVSTNDLQRAIDQAIPGFSATIISWNDHQHLSYSQMVTLTKARLKGMEDVSYIAKTQFYISELVKSS